MCEISHFREYGQHLEQHLRLKTHPIAIRLLRDGDEPPVGFLRPLRDLGHRLSLCQGFQMTRREGTTLAMLVEDNWCPEPVIGYGLAVPPDFFLDGSNRFPLDVATREAGRVFAEEMPRLPLGCCTGILAAPLASTPYIPDVIMVYGQPAQISTLLLAGEYRDGHNLPCSLSSHAACVYGVVPVLLSNRSHVALPCRGDRYAAMAGDDEMIITVTREELRGLLSALDKLESGQVFAKGYRIFPEYPLPKSYQEMIEIMGYVQSGGTGKEKSDS